MTILAACAGRERRVQDFDDEYPSRPPATWATMNGGAEDEAIPTKVSVNMRPTVIAGLAKLVKDVNQHAAPM
jgi:hypothetical protein